MGEVKLDITGLESSNDRMIIWGKMYLYFDVANYGKFKLTVKGGVKSYDFECHAIGH
jgi:hypothetical protein